MRPLALLLVAALGCAHVEARCTDAGPEIAGNPGLRVIQAQVTCLDSQGEAQTASLEARPVSTGGVALGFIVGTAVGYAICGPACAIPGGVLGAGSGFLVEREVDDAGPSLP